MSTVPLGLGNVERENSPSTSPQEGATPPSKSAQEGTTLPSISAEVPKPTRAVPSSWQPDLPPPEIPEQDGGLEFREPPPQDGLWATPCRVSDMGARQIDSDIVCEYTSRWLHSVLSLSGYLRILCPAMVGARNKS